MFRFGDPGGRMYTALGTSNANLLAWWTTINTGSGTVAISASNGRNGGSSLRFTTPSTGNPASISKTLDSQSTWGLAFGFRPVTPPTTAPVLLATFEDASSVQLDLRLNVDGTMSVTRNGTALTGGTSSAAVTTNAYAHYELKVKIDPSVGTVELRKNGVAVIGPLTALNTRSTSNSTANAVRIGMFIGNGTGYGNTPSADFDDVIVWDTQATDANGFSDIHDFIGDCGLAWLQPTGAGTTTQFTPDTGSNYARVNEATPDGDTSYAEDATVGHIDTYAMADLAAGASAVKSLAAVHYARKTDVGARGMKAELRSAGGNASHATEIALGNSYAYYLSNFGQDPNNGTPTNWTVAAVNAIEAGQTVSS